MLDIIQAIIIIFSFLASILVIAICKSFFCSDNKVSNIHLLRTTGYERRNPYENVYCTGTNEIINDHSSTSLNMNDIKAISENQCNDYSTGTNEITNDHFSTSLEMKDIKEISENQCNDTSDYGTSTNEGPSTCETSCINDTVCTVETSFTNDTSCTSTCDTYCDD